jgi:integrase/recombinase XerD
MIFLDLYRKHLEARLLVPATVRHHVMALSLFLRWLQDKDIRDVTLQTLLDYHASLQTKRNQQGGVTTIAYRNRQMWIVKDFFAFLHERRKILLDPGESFPVLRKPRRLPKGVLTNEQVLRLLAQPEVASPLGYRDRAILELLYSSGLRGLELARLTIYDVDFKDGTARILQGKWNRDRIVPLGKTAAGYLREYMTHVRPILLKKQSAIRNPKSAIDRLFLNNHGGALNTNVLRRLVRRHAKAAGLPPNTAAHGLRHACATEMLKGGANVRHVQELLGHSSLTTTQVYTRVVPVDLQKVHAATSPSERRKKLTVPEFECRGLRDPKNKVRLSQTPWNR